MPKVSSLSENASFLAVLLIRIQHGSQSIEGIYSTVYSKEGANDKYLRKQTQFTSIQSEIAAHKLH